MIEAYATRLYERPEETQRRYESTLSYVKGIIPKLGNNHSIIAFFLDYLNIVETVIGSSLLKQSDPNIQIVWGGPTITPSFDAFKLFLKKEHVMGL